MASLLAFFDVPFLDRTVRLLDIDERPFVSIASVCEFLNIPLDSQLHRISRHMKRNGLEAAVIDKIGWAIPLEELAWFLRTLRARDDSSKERWQSARCYLTWVLIDRFVRLRGRYMSSLQSRRFMDQMPIPATPVIRSGSHWSTHDAVVMRQMRAKGATLNEIGSVFNCSKTTASQIINGKYPIQLADSSPDGCIHGAESVRTRSLSTNALIGVPTRADTCIGAHSLTDGLFQKSAK